MKTHELNKMKFAGSWYSDNESEIQDSIAQFYSMVEKKDFSALAAVLPHAGHTFSGQGIATFFKNISPHIEQILILAPSHYEYLNPDTIYFGNFKEHETPLGNIPGISELFFEENNLFTHHPAAIQQEHSAEMFLPFIKHHKPDNIRTSIFLIPQLTSQEKAETIALEFFQEITARIDMNKTAIIASSDFTHYGTRFGYTPFKGSSIEEVEKNVAQLDKKYATYLADHAIESLYNDYYRENPTICGIHAASILSIITRERHLSGNFSFYYTSNDILGKSNDFVSYATILFNIEEV